MTPTPPRLALLPVSLFGAVMGIAGTSVAWRWASASTDTPTWIATAFAYLAAAVFVGLVAAYGAKAIRHFSAVRAEWSHPIKMAFVPTIPIAAMVLAGALHPIAASVAEPLWWCGLALQAVMTVGVVRAWIGGAQFTTDHIHPGWFIPAVGNIVAPLVGMNYAPKELMVGFFAVGIVYWLALFPMVLMRLVSATPLPTPMLPTLAILISPPAVGSIAWVAVHGEWGDAVSTTLLSVAVFQAVLLASQIPQLRRAPFGPPVWAYTFPLAALAVALLADAAATDCAWCLWSGLATLWAVTTIVFVALVRTVSGLARGTLLKPEPVPASAAKPAA